MTRRPIVLLDCDGPLAEFAHAYMMTAGHIVGRHDVPAEPNRWDIHMSDAFRSLARVGGMSTNQLRELVNARVSAPGWCASLRVTDGAREAVASLRKASDVYVVTTPWHTSPTWMHERTEWLKRHLGIPHQRVIYATNKALVFGDLLVDDKPANVREWRAQWTNGFGLLFDMQHNRALSGFARVQWAPESVDHIIAAARAAAEAEAS